MIGVLNLNNNHKPVNNWRWPLKFPFNTHWLNRPGCWEGERIIILVYIKENWNISDLLEGLALHVRFGGIWRKLRTEEVWMEKKSQNHSGDCWVIFVAIQLLMASVGYQRATTWSVAWHGVYFASGHPQCSCFKFTICFPYTQVVLSPPWWKLSMTA